MVRRRRSSTSSSTHNNKSTHPTCPRFKRKPGGPVPPEVREHALLLLASGMKRREVAEEIGVSTESLRIWRKRAEKEGTMPEPPRADPQVEPSSPPPPSMPQRAPKDPGNGLGAHEVEAILSLKKKHPSMGPAQIRTQLKRFKGWRVAVRAIARVLKANGYELVHTASRPKGQEEVRRWEAPHRNALWQMDFAELRVGPEKVALLLVQDDFSRYVVAFELMEHPTSERVVEALREAIRLHGKPEAVYTDRGGPFLSWNKASSLGAFLEKELIDHHVSPAYRPMGRGKIEALVGCVRRELWDLVHFASVDDARDALKVFFRRFNEGRAHMGIDGLTPADRFFGRWEAVREHVEAASRRRQGAVAAAGNSSRDPFITEEGIPDGPAEVLRLVVSRGRMELRFLGHRVELGEVKP